MNLFQYLAKIQRKTSFNKSEEAIFFNEHAYLFAKNDLWVKFPKASDPFDVVRGNIIIRSIINKETIEKAYLQKQQGLDAGETDSLSLEEYMRDILSSLPYITYENEKIYVPIFPEFLNIFYREEFEKLIQKPYKALLSDFQAAAIDSFDQYGIALFDSYFTK
ncbi:MAG: hypothetical protein K5694_00340, partial [Bacilli bacterium]|nr:hypothetical protein [Bacilli bacterium]